MVFSQPLFPLLSHLSPLCPLRGLPYGGPSGSGGGLAGENTPAAGEPRPTVNHRGSGKSAGQAMFKGSSGLYMLFAMHLGTLLAQGGCHMGGPVNQKLQPRPTVNHREPGKPVIFPEPVKSRSKNLLSGFCWNGLRADIGKN